MAVFDLHSVVALQNGWAALASDLTAFKNIFMHPSGTGFQLPEAVLDEWHATLVSRGVEVRASWTFGPPEIPVIGVRLEEVPSNLNPLGYFDRHQDGKTLRSMLTDQVIAVASYAPHAELTRALRMVVQAIMLDFLDFFHDLGYADVDFLGGGDLRPEELLMPEEVGQFMQVQRWKATACTSGTGTDVQGKDILVASQDVTVDNIPGGVVPQT